MSPTTKQQIRDKVDSYLSRTEKLKKSTEKKSTEKKSPKSGPVSSEPSSADNDDPDKARMMQRFAGQFYYMIFLI